LFLVFRRLRELSCARGGSSERMKFWPRGMKGDQAGLLGSTRGRASRAY
jgi:hypothetical protein